jgi:hypothetical protein
MHDPNCFGRLPVIPKIGVQNKFLLASLLNSITNNWPCFASFVPSGFRNLNTLSVLNFPFSSASRFVGLCGFMKEVLACAIFGYT